MPDLTDEDIQFIRDLREKHEDGKVNRRQALGMLGAAGVGAAGGFLGTGSAAADPSTTDSDGNVGTPSDPVDVFAEGIDSNSISTEVVNNVKRITEDRYSGDLGADINSAISDLPAAGGKIVIEPRSDGSRYSLSTKVTSSKPVTIEGPGRGVPLIDVRADVIAIETQFGNCELVGLNVEFGNIVHTSQGLHIGGRCQVDRCYVNNAGNNGIAVTDAYSGNVPLVTDSRVNNSGQNEPGNDGVEQEGNAILVEGAGSLSWATDSDGSGINSAWIAGNDFTGNAQNDVALKGSSRHTLAGNLYQGGVRGVLFGGSGRTCTAFGGHYEGHTSESVKFESQHNGSAVYAPTLNNGYVDNNGSNLIFQGSVVHQFSRIRNSDPTIDNNRRYQGKDTAGNDRKLVSLDNADRAVFADRDAAGTRIEGAPENLSGTSGFHVGDTRLDDGTNTTSGNAALCTWVDSDGDGTGDAWQDPQGNTFT